MPIKSKLISASLFTSVFLLTGCGNKADTTEASLAALEESCLKISILDVADPIAQKLCTCLKSKMKTDYTEKEHKIVSAVFSDAAKRIQSGQSNLSDVELIMLHSDFDEAETKRFITRVENDVDQCEKNSG